MMMRRRLFGLRLEQYWFDAGGYRDSRAHIAALRTTDAVAQFALRIPERTLWIDLGRPQEEILGAMPKGTRYSIRSAERRYALSRAASPEDRRAFHDHYALFARERRLPIPDAAEEEGLRIYLARDAEGALVHGCAFLPFPAAGIFRYRYGVRVRESNANPALLWRALCDSRAEGFRHFDLGGISGGAGRAGGAGDARMDGIDWFKSRFGGREVEGWLYLRSGAAPLAWGLKCLGPLVREERRLRRLLALLAPRVKPGKRRGMGWT